MSGTSRRFRFVRGLCTLLLKTHYRRIEVSGAERVPQEGPVVFVANHQNSLVDSMVLLHACPRAAAPLAKAPLFKNRMLRWFLEAVDAVPVYRAQDVAENEGTTVRANMATFKACREHLARDGSIALFPEGVSQPQPKLMPIRTGAARIALDVKAPVTVAPVGVVYEPPGGRRGRILVRFGEPFVVDGSQIEGTGRRGAIAKTTRRIESALRQLLAEAESQGDLAAMRTLSIVRSQEQGLPPADSLEAEHEVVQRLARGLVALRAKDPALVTELRARADAFQRSIDLAGVPLELLDEPYTRGRVLTFLFRTTLVLLFGFPLALLAAVVTFVPRFLGDVLMLRITRATEDVFTFSRIVGQSFMVLVAGILAGILLGVFVSPWVGLGALIAFPALFAVTVLWRDWWYDVHTRVRTFFLLAGGGLRRDLQRRRRELNALLEKAAQRLAEDETPVSEPAPDALA